MSRQLFALNDATQASDMDLPGWRLHALNGELAGQWAVRVSGNWRLTFLFIGKDAELFDYQAAIVGRLYEKLGRQVAGNTSQLLGPQGGSFEKQAPGLVTAASIKILLLLLVLTEFISLFLCIVVDAPWARRNAL